MLLACGSLPTVGWAQGTAAQYEWVQRARSELGGKVLNQRPRLHWIDPQDRWLWFREQTSLESHRFLLVDTQEGSRRPAFDHRKLAEQLSQRAGTTLDADALPLDGMRFADDVSTLSFSFAGQRYQLDLASDTLRTATEAAAALDGARDGLPAMRRLKRVRGGGPETNITFVNQRDEPVTLKWLDAQGDLRTYGTLQPGRRRSQHTFANHVWVIVDQDAQPLAAVQAVDTPGLFFITEQVPPPLPLERAADSRPRRPGRHGDTSPDGRYRIRIDDGKVVLESTGKPQPNDPFDPDSRHVLQPEPGEGTFDGRVFWSPDSRYCVLLRTERVEPRQVTIVESAPEDRLQPRVHQFSYAKPGDALDHPRPYLCDAEAKTLRAVDDALFDNPFALKGFNWKQDSSAFRFVYNARGHQRLAVIEVDPATCGARVLVENTSDTFVDYAGKQFLHYLDDRDQLIWMSERDGWNHLYLIDQQTGRTIRQLTKGPWVVRDVERVDAQRREMWIVAGGYYPDQDPYQKHLLRVSLDDAAITPLTDGDGNHQWEQSPTQKFLITRFSRVDLPPVTQLRDMRSGRLICQLTAADWTPLLEKGWQPPQRFVAKGRDGQTDIHGIIIRPRGFQAGKTYPVLEGIYAGPHSAFVPKSFGLHRGLADLADLGFIVVKIDGMGTSHRSKAFHDVCWRNLADSGFPDRIAWMRRAAEQIPEMDLGRVGIWGGSAGGQSALGALLNHGDFYHAAVADCGCHDNRMDKIWWNELWMGWPVGPHYAQQSNVTRAHRLEGALMLTVGELDRNVDPASTMQVVDALIKADKDFDLVVFPGGGHGVGESEYGRRRRADFFVRHLWNREPRSP